MHSFECADMEQICVIVNFGAGSKLLRAAREHGVSGGTVFLGKGTVNSRILDFLGLSDIRKEIVLIISERNKAYKVLEELDKEFDFEKPNHGIAFTTSVNTLIGHKMCTGDNLEEKRSSDAIMYQSITAIVEKGKAEYVINAAVKAGSKGGTVVNARGSGTHETSRLFSMDVEPEKEIVMILSEKDKTDAIVASIREELKIDEPGQGILYVQDVNKTYGLYKED